ncbi:hypothetical protein [Bacillus thuringiensis]|uniref:hypothetical protein n=1 Tax=Bacillus thuringiensis TaxID=1428 RepID=UPI001159B867|nr:hypothetical protein [Bacillus thuringiensis]
MAFGQATAYLGVVFCIIVIVLVVFILFKYLFIDEVLRWGDQRISYLIEILQSVKFSLTNPEYLGEFEKQKHVKECIRSLLSEYEINKDKKQIFWFGVNNRKFRS